MIGVYKIAKRVKMGKLETFALGEKGILLKVNQISLKKACGKFLPNIDGRNKGTDTKVTRCRFTNFKLMVIIQKFRSR